MTETIDVGGIQVVVLRKEIKNLQLSVYPPTGEVRISAPTDLALETVRLFALTKLGWIQKSRRNLLEQAREPERDYVERESHYLWGKRLLLHVVEPDATPKVDVKHSQLVLRVRPGASRQARHEIISAWYREELRAQVGPLIKRWSALLDVRVEHVFVQQMKTKWGSCNPGKETIRLNTELAKKPLECLEYVVLHELAHMIDPSHGKTFIDLLDRNLPSWRGTRDRLNQAPLSHTGWSAAEGS